MALMHCLNDLRSTKLNKNVNVPKDFRLGSDEKFVSPPKQRRKRYQRKKSQIKGQQFQIKLQIPQPKAVSDIRNFLKSMKTIDLTSTSNNPNL